MEIQTERKSEDSVFRFKLNIFSAVFRYGFFTDEKPEKVSFGERIRLYISGIVNAILALFKKLFG